MKRSFVAIACCLLASALCGAPLYEHGIYDAVSLDGEWEMAYRPYAHESVNYPEFAGVKVARAVPGHWEEMVPALRAAGIAGEAGIDMVIANGANPALLYDILDGRPVGTRFIGARRDA